MLCSRCAQNARSENPHPFNAGRRSRKILFVMGFFLLAVAGCSTRQAEKLPSPTAEETAYLPKIEISGVRMTASENFLQHVVTTLHASVTNKGNKTVSYLEMDVAFLNYSNQVDYRSKEHPIDANKPPLKPGETRQFEISYDQLPEDWNQAAPQITPLRVVLAENQ